MSLAIFAMSLNVSLTFLPVGVTILNLLFNSVADLAYSNNLAAPKIAAKGPKLAINLPRAPIAPPIAPVNFVKPEIAAAGGGTFGVAIPFGTFDACTPPPVTGPGTLPGCVIFHAAVAPAYIFIAIAAFFAST